MTSSVRGLMPGGPVVSRCSSPAARCSCCSHSRRWSFTDAFVYAIDTAIKLFKPPSCRGLAFSRWRLTIRRTTSIPTEQLPSLRASVRLPQRGPVAVDLLVVLRVVAAPLVPYGVEWAVVALAMMGTQSPPSTSTLDQAGAHPHAAGPCAAGTPVWLYGLTRARQRSRWGAASAAMAVALRVRGARGDWVAGLLLGVARCCATRCSCWLPGLLYARHLEGHAVRHAAASWQARRRCPPGHGRRGPLVVRAADARAPAACGAGI